MRYAIDMTLGTLAVVALGAALALTVTLVLPRGRAWLSGAVAGYERHVIGAAWIVAFTATSGSLYLSDFVGLQPCLLCWYQRIAMYPLVIVLGVGALRGDTGVWRFALPLALIGLIISSYHVALQYQPSLELLECTAGVPCTARLLVVHGFVSIPVMAGSAFWLIATLLAGLLVKQGPALGSDTETRRVV